MSQFESVANRVMDVIGEFPALAELSSEDVDIAFFAKMDFTVAIVKAIAGVEKEQNPLILPVKPHRYFKSDETKGLWIYNNDRIYFKYPDNMEWEDATEIWVNIDSLIKCSDIVEITDSNFYDLTKGQKMPPI